MRKITIALASLVLALLMSPVNSLFANEEVTPKVDSDVAVSEDDQIIEEMMATFDSSKKVLQLPDGGFVQGEIIEYEDESENAKITAYYNSELSKDAVSVARAKNILKSEAFKYNVGIPKISTYGSTIPTKPLTLGDGSSYKSSKFSASGWRYSELKFKPADGTGKWLLWTSCGDSAKVGTLWQAMIQTGTTLQPGTPTYVDATDWLMYYTYDPVKNSYYVVENK